MRDPYASLMLHGVKTLETRNYGMLSGVQGLCLLHVGFQTMDQEEAGVFLWNAGFSPEDIERLTRPPKGFDRGAVLGLVELGRTRQLDSGERASKATQRKVASEAVGTFATEVLRAWWLPQPLRLRGQAGVWRARLPRAWLPPEVRETAGSAPKAATSGSPAPAPAATQSKYPTGGGRAKLPRLVVFDLDGICWSPEMYQTAGGPPYRLVAGGAVALSNAGEEIRLFDAVRHVWAELRARRVRIGVASSSQRHKALALLDTFQVRPGLSMAAAVGDGLLEMYYRRGEGKRPHMLELLRKSRVPPGEVLFVDNELDNVRSVAGLGIVAAHLRMGLTEQAWAGALALYEGKQRR